VVDDFEKDWVYAEDYFDFVHARVIMGYVLSKLTPIKDYKRKERMES
jgi:hypothetical protein